MDSNTQEDLERQPFDKPAVYELRVVGRLGRESSTWFEDMTLEVDQAATPPLTIIRGVMRDQAALYGLISRIRDLGLTLQSVTQPDQEDS